jgi:hypothetical protein
MISYEEKIKSTIVQLIHWLVTENYAAIDFFSGGNRLSANELKEAVAQYGKKLIPLPSVMYESIDVILIKGHIPKRWSVRVDLWAESEGRSDLSLECTLIDSVNKLMEVEVDNLHVL